MGWQCLAQRIPFPPCRLRGHRGGEAAWGVVGTSGGSGSRGWGWVASPRGEAGGGGVWLWNHLQEGWSGLGRGHVEWGGSGGRRTLRGTAAQKPGDRKTTGQEEGGDPKPQEGVV